MKIIGHQHAIRYLSGGLESGRLSPSLIFVGADGVGKRTLALELAKDHFCMKPVQRTDQSLGGCDSCPACTRAAAAGHPDLMLLDRTLQAVIVREKPESQTMVKIEGVRHAEQFLQLKPLEGRRRVVVIDEAHKLTEQAANALLKTLEEPPNNAQVVLLANDEKSLLPTIRSRCATVRLGPVPIGPLAAWLERHHDLSPEESFAIADRSGGSFSRAIALKDAEETVADLAQYRMDEFFEIVGGSNLRKEGRETAQRAVTQLIELAQKKLDQGDLSQLARIGAFMDAQRQLKRNVTPRLVLENLYLTLERPLTHGR